jgi:hypothetical protein
MSLPTYYCNINPFDNDHKLYKPVNGYYGCKLVNPKGDSLGFHGHELSDGLLISFEKNEFKYGRWVREPRMFRIDPDQNQAFLDMLRRG